MKRLILLAALSLVACGGRDRIPPQPIVVPQEVVVAGPARACVPATVGAAPAYPDTDEALRAAPNAATRYMLVAAGRLLRAARLLELEPVVETCRK